MIRYRVSSFFMVVSLILLGCDQKGGNQSKSDSDNSSDGQNITIGKQVWMTRNLDVSTFRNGDSIPEAKTEGEWKAYREAGEAAWCYYDNDTANGVKYGKLYNWYAVSDPRGLVPKGWHIPSDKEWSVLTDYLGGEEKAGAKMKSNQGWAQDGIGTNSSGFSGLPGGRRNFKGLFVSIGNDGFCWSSTEYETSFAWYRNLNYANGNLARGIDGKGDGLSVRCLRD